MAEESAELSRTLATMKYDLFPVNPDQSNRANQLGKRTNMLRKLDPTDTLNSYIEKLTNGEKRELEQAAKKNKTTKLFANFNLGS